MNYLKIMNGKLVSQKIINNIKLKIEKYKKNNQRMPKLIIIQIGDNNVSNIYINNKKKVCQDIGILFQLLKYKNNITENKLINCINKLNNDKKIDGIIIQLPIPKHISLNTIINRISILKDVDGFNSYNLGNLMINKNKIIPATPKGVITLLNYYNINLNSKHVVIVGRSNIVGKPLASLMINYNATVTICHSKTKNLSKFTKQADILITAIGKPKIIKKHMIKDNVIIVDIGINYDENNHLCGDIDFNDVINKVKAITPVPGGVGPMTISSLLENIIYLYELH